MAFGSQPHGVGAHGLAPRAMEGLEPRPAPRLVERRVAGDGHAVALDRDDVGVVLHAVEVDDEPGEAPRMERRPRLCVQAVRDREGAPIVRDVRREVTQVEAQVDAVGHRRAGVLAGQEEVHLCRQTAVSGAIVAKIRAACLALFAPG